MTWARAKTLTLSICSSCVRPSTRRTCRAVTAAGTGSRKPCAARAIRRACWVVSRSTSAILPAVHVRTATVEDAAAVEAVRLRGWQAAYRGIVPDSYLDGMEEQPERRAAVIVAPSGVTTLVAEDEGAVVGMAVFGPARDGEDAVELYALYVEPGRWRAGVGTSLLAACEGVSVLWVLEDNTRARAFYGRHGFVADGASQVLDLGGPVTEVRMRRG